MSYEFTVARPFTMPKGNGGQFTSYVPGQKITDPAEMDEIAKANGRNVVRHFVTTPAVDEKPAEAGPAADATSEPEPARQTSAPPVGGLTPVSKPTPSTSASSVTKN